MRSVVTFLCAAAVCVAMAQPSWGGGFTGELSGGALPPSGGFTPLQRGFGAPAGPWGQGGQEPFAQPGRGGLLPRHPEQRRHGWRRRPYGYGVGLVYPYFDEGGEEVFEEEPPLPPTVQTPPSPPPKPSAGPKTVSAPPAAAVTEPVSTAGGLANCGKGRKVSLSGARAGAVGCISP